MFLKMLHINYVIVFGKENDLQKSKKSPTSKSIVGSGMNCRRN